VYKSGFACEWLIWVVHLARTGFKSFCTVAFFQVIATNAMTAIVTAAALAAAAKLHLQEGDARAVQSARYTRRGFNVMTYTCLKPYKARRTSQGMLNYIAQLPFSPMAPLV
jgi:hypothetical protein